MRGRLLETPIPGEVGQLSDIAPVHLERRSVWLLLGRGGTIHRLDAESGESTRIASATIREEPGHEPWVGHALSPHLYASGHGEFAALVNDYGRYGQIIDLRSGEVTLSLDGGEYHPETVPFSFAFVEVGGRTVAIHRTAWNRLDASDPLTGKLLTRREPTSYQRGEPRPEHYLDYFHGALHVSPDGEYVVDDGWVWHPVGVPTVWSLRRWLGGNVWESEDGPSKLDVCAREYYWDHGMAWLDSSRLVVGGIGDDDDEMIEGARIFDVSSKAPPRGDKWRADLRWARALGSFAGPAGRFFSDGARLFSSDETGLSVWSPEGRRIESVENFHPTHHHPRAAELAEVIDTVLVRFRTDERAQS